MRTQFLTAERLLPPINLGVDGISRLLTSRRRSVRFAQLLSVLLVGLLIRFAFIASPGYHDDIVIFADWFKSIARLPLAQVYADTPGLNYPPMCVLLYKLEAVFLHSFVHSAPTDSVINIAIKLPPILIDGATTVLAYRIVRRSAGHGLALLSAAFIALNPAIIYDSAYWGQNDSIPTFLALMAVSQLRSGNVVMAWLLISCGVLFKPPVLLVVPLMFLHPFTAIGSERARRLFGMCCGIASAFVVIEIIAVTFFDHPSLIVATRHLIGQFAAFSHVFKYNSLNGFNLWALFQQFFVSDQELIFGIPAYIWGNVIFGSFAALIYLRYLRSRGEVDILEAATLVLLAFFLFLTEMHERYLYYAVVFCAVLVFHKRYRIGALILSVTLLLNLEYGLTFMYLDDAKITIVNRFAFAPWLTHIAAATNIAVFFVLLVHYLQPRPSLRTTASDE